MVVLAISVMVMVTVVAMVTMVDRCVVQGHDLDVGGADVMATSLRHVLRAVMCFRHVWVLTNGLKTAPIFSVQRVIQVLLGLCD